MEMEKERKERVNHEQKRRVNQERKMDTLGRGRVNQAKGADKQI